MITKRILEFFKTKDGHIVIGQFPNWPLFLATGFYFLESWGTGDWKTLGSVGLTTTLIYWSYLEIRFGVNGWRKFVGWSVLLWSIFGIFR